MATMLGSEGRSSERTTVIGGDQHEALRRDVERARELGACLIVIRGAQQGQRFLINREELFIGRDPGADIRIQETSISRRHARIMFRDGLVRILDNDSSNGTFVNGTMLAPGEAVTLVKDDQIELGNSIVKFLPPGDLEILTFDRIDRAANTDALTQIFNKRYLLEVLDREVDRMRALGSPYAVVFCDLDHFKRVNDTYGHDAGDHVLEEFARLVKTKFVRGSDVFARYGGEEFVVLLPSTTAEDALKVAERIRTAVASHVFTYGAHTLTVTASIGVAELTDDVESGIDLLKRADKAMYASKDGGRDRVSLGHRA